MATENTRKSHLRKSSSLNGFRDPSALKLRIAEAPLIRFASLCSDTTKASDQKECSPRTFALKFRNPVLV